MRLTNVVVRNAKPQEKPYKLVDGRGLYVLVNKAGKYFRWDYRFAGKRKTFALGVYPEISLKEAREKHEDLRRLLATDIDPMEIKKQKKAEVQSEVENTTASEFSCNSLDSTFFHQQSLRRYTSLIPYPCCCAEG